MRPGGRILLVLSLAYALVSGVVPFVPGVVPADAVGESPCPPTPIVTVSPGSGATPADLNTYQPDGTLVSSVQLRTEGGGPLPAAIGDIALNATGTELYGIQFLGGSSDDAQLWVFDPATGLRTSTVNITGLATGYGGLMQGLSPSADGQLYVGAAGRAQIYKVDPATGAATLFSNFPTGYSSAGDFLTLSDGSVLGIANGTVAESTLFRFDADGSNPTIVGRAPVSFGAAQSGNDLYLAGADGQLRSLPISSIPTTASTATLATTSVTSAARGYNGATSIQDAGCPATYTVAKTATSATSPAGSALPGETITYDVTVTNTSAVPYTTAAAASFTDDLAGVLDDATLVGTVTSTAGTAQVTGNTLTWSGPLAAQGDPGSVVTVSYTVTVNQRAALGDHRIANVVTPTGFGGTCTSAANCATVTEVPGTWNLAKTSDPASGSEVAAGDTITYTLTADNPSGAAVGNIVVTDDLSRVLDNAAFGAFTDDDGGNATRAGTTLTWNVGTLAGGQTRTVVYTVTVNTGVAGVTLANSASGAGDVPPTSCTPAAPCETTAMVPPPTPPTVPPTTQPTAPPTIPTTTVSSSPTPPQDVSSNSSNVSSNISSNGSLPRTGGDPRGLTRTGLALAGAGALILSARARRRKREGMAV